MEQITQTGRLLKVFTPLDFDVLMINSFSGSEEISRPYRFELKLVSDVQAGMPGKIGPEKLLGKAIAIEVELADGKTRFLNGLMKSFTIAGRDERLAYYRAEMVPWFAFLEMKSDCRIFQDKTVPEIITAVVEELGYKAFLRNDLRREYTKWDYCVQYRETDLNFLSRLMEDEGIAYHFEHKEDRTHVLVLTDPDSAIKDCPRQSSFRFDSDAGLRLFEDVVRTWDTRQRILSSKWTLRDSHFEVPKKSLEVSESSLHVTPENQTLDVFDYPGDYAKKFNKPQERLDNVRPEGTKLVRLRMEQDENNHVVNSGESTGRAMVSGHKFTVAGEAQIPGGPYLLTSVSHKARQSPGYVTDGAIGGPAYSNSFACIPASVPFVPTRSTPKPIAPGPQTARVIDGNPEPTEEIWPDKYGRVRVRFPWDREAKNACWIRVAQPWAGRGWGHQWIPRVGDEVVVSFLEGDLDRPIIIGSVYNGDNLPPFSLPDNKTQSGVKTRSSPHGGSENFNMLRFEDKKGHECLEIHAERTMVEGVEASQFVSVGGDRHITTGGVDKNGNKQGDVKEKVFKNHNLHVLNDDRGKIEGKQSVTVVGDSGAQYSGGRSVQVSGDELVIAKTITFQAQQTITLMAGVNSIVIGPSGVTVIGVPMINLNPIGAVPPIPPLMPLIDAPDDP
ncbi:MAG: type VI secretion system tip protein VgrG [Acidobacteriota bacterium]|nr:type VI secretion system tip protein VgrG [Acidobacteriota bacterium]